MKPERPQYKEPFVLQPERSRSIIWTLLLIPSIGPSLIRHFTGLTLNKEAVGRRPGGFAFSVATSSLPPLALPTTTSFLGAFVTLLAKTLTAYAFQT